MYCRKILIGIYDRHTHSTWMQKVCRQKDRSRYYKASSIFAASVAEAMVFLIVKNFYNANPETVIDQSMYSYRPLYRLPPHFLRDGVGSVVYMKKKRKILYGKELLIFQTLNRIGLRWWRI